jgi:hypothetical protein
VEISVFPYRGNEMRIVSNIVGIVLALIGAVWLSQGMNLIRVGFMAGHRRWILIGGVVLIVGVIVLILGNRKKAEKISQ